MVKLVPLVGSEPRTKQEGAVQSGGNQRITVTVKLKSKADGKFPSGHPIVGHANFANEYGADPTVIKKVVEYATSHGLGTVESDAAKRRVILTGKVSQFEKAFGTDIKDVTHPHGTFRVHTGPIHVPEDLADDIEAVLGLSNHPIAKPHFRMRPKGVAASGPPGGQSPRPMTTVEVAKAYNFPTNHDGSGTCIGLIELGGGYEQVDMTKYFKAVGKPVPTLVDVSVLGGTNTPGSDADGEVELDIQVAGTVAPKAKVAVYFSPNTTQGFVAAITDAAHDTVNKPDVISISWGGPEPTWTYADMLAMTNAMRDATTLGVTVLAASGDDGSDDGVGDGLAHVDFPACSPYALGCGGTRLVPSNKGGIVSETVWNDQDNGNGAGGGGISHHYPVPSFQSAGKIPSSSNSPAYFGRGVPDVSGNADPQSGYEVIVDGQEGVVGGTSAVAPLYAGLLALIVQSKGKRLGFINTALYTTAKGAFRQVTAPGNNGSYSAKPNDFWNACSGLGSIDGSKLLSLL